MYNIVIADDDELLLKGLSTLFDWASLEIEVVASVDDGDKVLTAMKDYKADILLTDIKMTNMDGLTLIAKVKEDYPKTSVVVMSAYDDFSYAQKALRLEVKDYMVKPIDLELLVNRMKEIVQEKKEKELQEEKFKEIAVQNKEVMQEMFFKNLLLNQFSKAECMIKADEFINVENLYWQVIEIIFDDSSNIQDKNDTINKLIHEYEYVRVEMEEGFNFICCSGKRDSFTQNIDRFKKDCRDSIREKYSDQTLSFINGTVVDNIYSLTISYNKILQMNEYRYSEGKNVNLYEADLEKYFNINHTINKTIIDNLSKLVLLGNANMIPEYIKKLKENLKYLGSNSKVMLTYALSILLEEIGKNLDLSKIYEDDDNIYKKILNQGTLNEALIILEKILINISEKIYKKENYSNIQLIKRACNYIEEKYMDSSLRIIDVASYVNLSHNYFSTLFQEVIGKSFTDYLVERRMKAAQELIVSTKYKGNEICFMVGYDNPAYFCTTFKKFVGVTTSQYRSMVKPQY